MTQFCTCGSMMISGSCTNKNCSTRSATKAAPLKSGARKKAASAEKGSVKSAKTRRASKCITYNLYDTDKEENV